MNNTEILATHTIAEKLQNFPVRAAFSGSLGSLNLSPSLAYIQSIVPVNETESIRIMRRWLNWAFWEISITTSVVDSRGGMLLTTLARKYTDRRELAVLAALKIGNDQKYDKEL